MRVMPSEMWQQSDARYTDMNNLYGVVLYTKFNDLYLVKMSQMYYVFDVIYCI